MVRYFLAAFISLFIFSIKTTAQAPQTIKTDSLSEMITIIRLSLDSIGNPDSLSDEEVQNYAYRFSEQAAILKTQFATEVRYVVYARENLQQRLTALKKISTAPDSLISSVQKDFSEARQKEKAWKNLSEKANKTAENATHIARIPIPEMRYSIVSLEKNIQNLLDEADLLSRNPKATKPENQLILAKKAEKLRSKPHKNAGDFTIYKTENDPMFNPPLPVCQVENQGRDEFTGELRRESKPELLFTFTNDFMKNYLKDKPHILCESSVSAMSNGARFLNLTLKINENNAKKSFGGLNRGNQLILKFIDGSVFTLQNARTDEGLTDEIGGFTTFHGIYPLEEKTVIAAIRKKELDKIRIAWNTGFEDYEIFSVDLLEHQANCVFN